MDDLSESGVSNEAQQKSDVSNGNKLAAVSQTVPLEETEAPNQHFSRTFDQMYGEFSQQLVLEFEKLHTNYITDL